MLKKYHEFVPKSITFLKKYNFNFFKKDLFAGVTVGIVAFPLAMAFAIASGVSPERGLYTAIVAGFLIAFLGGTRVQIGGPTGAFVVVVYGIIERQGYDGLVLATLIASFFLIGMGVMRLGNLIKYIPHPLVVGFTTGIAGIVFTAQIKDFFGLQTGPMPAAFLQKWEIYFHCIDTFDPWSIGVAIASLGIILLARRYLSSLPWGIIAIVLATTLCYLLDIPVDTISSRFGTLPTSLPFPSLPSNFSRVFELIPDALTIAFLAGVESLFSAMIADNLTGFRHKSNCELIAQGFANMASALFGGMPATAAIARTATNIKSGAETPVAGMIHAAVVFLIMVSFSQIAGYIPLAALSAVLMVVAWNMSELSHFWQLLKAPKGDVAILLTSFTLTLLVDITVAVEAGMVLAAFLFLKKMSNQEHVILKEQAPIAPDVTLYEMKGPFFFGVADRLKDVIRRMEEGELSDSATCFVLRMKDVPSLDATGVHALKEFQRKLALREKRLILSHVQKEPEKLMRNFGLGPWIGEEP